MKVPSPCKRRTARVVCLREGRPRNDVRPHLPHTVRQIPVLTFWLGVELMAGWVAQEPLAVAQPLKVDHASVCGSELEPLQQAFAAAGLKNDYGWPLANGITLLALLGFEVG